MTYQNRKSFLKRNRSPINENIQSCEYNRNFQHYFPKKSIVSENSDFCIPSNVQCSWPAVPKMFSFVLPFHPLLWLLNWFLDLDWERVISLKDILTGNSAFWKENFEKAPVEWLFTIPYQESRMFKRT